VREETVWGTIFEAEGIVVAPFSLGIGEALRRVQMLMVESQLILQDWLSEKKQTHWKREMSDMNSRVED
jgi:hypothetical protein